MKTKISVPDVIILEGDVSERLIRLESCHNQNEIMDYLKICLSLFSVNPETTTTIDAENSKNIEFYTNIEHTLSQNNRSDRLLVVP